jgi:hypothetical protein
MLGMGWQSDRPVPYRRLAKEWLVYAAVMLVVFFLLLRDSTNVGGMAIGLAVSFPLWIGISYALAKFGYQRKTMAELRAARMATGARSAERSAAASPTRPRPAPTRRTASGPNRSRRRGR